MQNSKEIKKKLKPVHKGNLSAAKIIGPLWDQFSPNELRKEHHRFLVDIIKKIPIAAEKIKIFESCLGTGLDAIPLAKLGYNIVANEFYEDYLKTAEKNIQAEKLPIQIINYNWLNLSRYRTKVLFDALLCMGNSICYIFGRDSQRKSLENFKKLLKDKGILIIDERNFQFMLDNRVKILGEKNKITSDYQKHKDLKRHFLYGGDNYYPYPVEINTNVVKMGIFKKGQNIPISHFYFYPFKHGELLNLLKELFEKIEIYSDYKRGCNKNAGFYQYICTK